uniref:Platelet-derived growth factor (PDGF) family profile domain-containing protein n=1 Tax=Amphiprion ocellaris TaxID=80972 RepID=A0AAQ6A487_AMPOC
HVILTLFPVFFHLLGEKALVFIRLQTKSSYSILLFSVILEEIQRTSCQPREVCVEVAKEYPESTSQFYLPRCVALHRCGGCCTNEAFYCTNTIMQFLALELFNNTPRLECAPFCAPAPQTEQKQHRKPVLFHSMQF